MNYNISPLTNRLPGLQTFIQNQELNTGNIYSQGMKGSLIQVKKQTSKLKIMKQNNLNRKIYIRQSAFDDNINNFIK